MHEPFSLLISVYHGDRPDYLRRAFRSAVHDQTVRPDQVIIVRDGPVRAELAECLDELRATSPVPVTFVPLERNSGLGPALDRGRCCALAGQMSPAPGWLPAAHRGTRRVPPVPARPAR